MSRSRRSRVLYGGWITSDIVGPFKGAPARLAGSGTASTYTPARVHPPRSSPRSSPRYSRRTARRPRARWRSLLLWALLAGVVVVSIGTIYQFISVTREQRRFPPPGRLVDIGGRRLHLLCLGDGAPTVIMESSGLGTSVSAAAVREAVSHQTRVCSYDRAGLGWSDAGAAEISAGDFADDLLRLLDRGSIRPPYLLVPTSVGGLTAEMFARRNPDRIAGMVWLDAADSGVLERVTARLRSTVISIETPVCLARVGQTLASCVSSILWTSTAALTMAPGRSR